MCTWADQTLEKILRKYSYGIQVAQRDHIIPYQGNGDHWEGPPYDRAAWWTNGFWPALLWQLYHASGDTAYATEARRVQSLLVEEMVCFTGLHHDVGFQYLLSSGAEHRLTGNEDAWRTVLHAATILAGRFNPNGFIRAWNGEGREGWAIIDCMMNLPLLHWATRETGDPRFSLIANRHTDTTLQHFLRPDGSTNHIVIFDAHTGAMLDAPGGQGMAPGSSWSRGQAWALYGFTLSFLNTGEARHLEAAERMAAYFIRNIREDGLTSSDFSQPKDEDLVDNIAAAVASCGLLELANVTGTDKAATYREAALRMLTAMDTLCADYSEDRCGILQRCTASYHDDGAGRHTNMVYGDYFFLEAICKLRGEDIMPWKA